MISNTLTEVKLRGADALCNLAVASVAAAAAVTFGGVAISTAVGGAALAALVSAVAGKALDYYAENNERVMNKTAVFATAITALVMLGIVGGVPAALGISVIAAPMFAVALASGLIASRYFFKGLSQAHLQLFADVAKYEAAKAAKEAAEKAAEKAPLVVDGGKTNAEAQKAIDNQALAQSEFQNCNGKQNATPDEKAAAKKKFDEAHAVYDEFKGLYEYQMARGHLKTYTDSKVPSDLAYHRDAVYVAMAAIPSVKKWQDEMDKVKGPHTAEAAWEQIKKELSPEK